MVTFTLQFWLIGVTPIAFLSINQTNGAKADHNHIRVQIPIGIYR